MRLLSRISFTLFVITLLSMVGSVPASASVSSQESPVDVYTPERIDRPIDLLSLRAIEETTSPTGNWSFHLLVEAALGTIQLTKGGTLEYGVFLDYDLDSKADYLLRSSYDATEQFVLDQEDSELINLFTGQVECRGTLFSDVHILDLGGGQLRVAYALTLHISKSCLPPVTEVGLAAYGKNLESTITDRVPDAGFVLFQQPWVTAQDLQPQLRVQRAGSEVVVVSNGETGYFTLRDGFESVAEFELGSPSSAAVIKHRATGKLTIWRYTGQIDEKVEFEETKELLWFKNTNLGLVSPTALTADQSEAIRNLANDKELLDGRWVERDSGATKLICTGIYGPRASLADKIEARKRAKAACEFAKLADADQSISFWYQTKETKAQSYVNKVLLTVKGLKPEVVAGLR